MQTDFPTTTFYFVFAFTYCKLRVYSKNSEFARRLLDAVRVEFLTEADSKGWHEFDTRILLDLLLEKLPKLVTINVAAPMNTQHQRVKR